MTAARSRILFPLTLSAGLLALDWVVQHEPLRFGRYGDIREVLFGTGYRGLLFVALIPLMIVAVRVLDALAFDVALSRRKTVAAPRLLRDIVSLVLYFLLISWALSVLFEY